MPAWLPFLFQHQLTADGTEITLTLGMAAAFPADQHAQNVQVRIQAPSNVISYVYCIDI